MLRYSIVTSGRRLSDGEVDALCQAIRQIKEETNISVCVSVGLLDEMQYRRLKEAGAEVGVSFYHGEDISLEEKIRRDEDFFRSTETGYVYSAAYAGGTEFQAVAELEGMSSTSALVTAWS